MTTQADMIAFVDSIKNQLVKRPELQDAAKKGRYALAQVLTEAMLIEAVKDAAKVYAKATEWLGDGDNFRAFSRQVAREFWDDIRKAA